MNRSFFIALRRCIHALATILIPGIAVSLAVAPAWAQMSSMRVSTPSPTAASLGRFGDIPVSLYSGTPDVSIPLFTVRGRTLELPIVLKYSGGGIRVEEIGGWAGIGWALEAGGVITRSVRGIPDDDVDGFLYTGGAFYSGSNWYAPSQAFVELLRDGFQDSQPDQYFFSFAGRSGQFMYGPDSTSTVIRSIPYQKLRIQPVIGTRGQPITAWEIVAEDGTVYTFAASEESTDLTANAPLPPGKKSQTYRSSWHLTQIRSVGGDTITLQYATYLATHRQGTHEQRFDLVQSSNGQCAPQNFDAINEQRNFTQRLTSITAGAHTVTFTPSDTLRSDALSPIGTPQEPRLRTITVATPQGRVLRRFAFDHDYSTGRLTLRNIFEQDSTGAQLPPWSFTYSGTLPSTTSRGQDHWGYANGVLWNSSLIPAMLTPGGVALSGADRSPNASHASLGILTKVTYPTGGWSEFVWEGNDYGTSLSGPLTMPVTYQYSVGPAIDDVVNFTISGTQSVLAEIWHDRGPEGCEESYFSCPHSTLTGPGINWTFTGTASFTQTLPPGSYTLRTKRNALGEPPPDPWATATVKWTEHVSTTRKPGGGVRLSELRTADAMGTVTTSKYKYRLQSDTAVSSGIVQYEPAYGYQFNSGYCSYFNRTSLSRMPLGSGGPLVAYQEVTVWHGANGEFGRTLHRFRTVADAPDQGQPSPDWYPFAQPTSYAWKRGQEHETAEYTASNVIQRRGRSIHVFRDAGASPDTATTRRLRGVSINFFEDGSIGGGAPPSYVFNNFSVVSAWTHLVSDTTIVFDTTGTSSFASARSYVYGNPSHVQMTEMTETNSDGTQRITKLRYPGDFATGSGNAEAVALSAMQGAAHIHSPVIERWITQRTGATDSVVQAEVTSFKTFGTGQYLPYQRFVLNSPTALTNFVPSAVSGGVFTKDSRYLLQETANAYDAFGRITQLADARGKLTDYLYGGNPNSAFLARVTRRKDPGDVTDLVTDLAYDSLGFLASITDEGGSVRRFSYDLFGRLRRIRNHNDSAVKAFGYVYSRTSPSWTFNAASPNAVVDTTFIQHTPTPKSLVSTQFLDGLGRPIQTVVQDGSSFVVSPTQYDLMGRPWRAWKPYTRATAGYDASFSTNATSFYNTYHSASNAKPYAETQYRADALDRVSKVIPEFIGTAPTVFSVHAYGIDAAAKQTIAEIADPLGKKTRSFADLFGNGVKTILGAGAPEATTTTLASDVLGQLRRVTDPRGVWTTYQRDTRGLLMEWANPDAEAVTSKYDVAGNRRYWRDENQREAVQSQFMTYDFANRPLVSGLGASDLAMLDPDAASPPALETTHANWLVVRAYDAKPSTSAFPWSLFSAEITPLSLANVSGRLAAIASKSNGAWQATLLSYDADGRVVTRHTFTQANGGSSVLAALNTQVQYVRDLRDAVTERRLTVGANTFNHWNEFDGRGLLWKVFASTSGVKPATPDVTFTYRPSGQPKDRQFQGGPLVPVRYTIREELEKIGDPALTTYPFSARYAYHANGTVSESEFYSAGSPASQKRYKYAFSTSAYDALNRLKSADFSGWTGSSWSSTLAHDLANIGYDAAGNITSLQRYRETATLVDNLSYSYSAGSNRLNAVTDAVGVTPESWDAESGSFGYDAVGNVITAPAPYGISAVTYDHQNLPLSLTSNGVTSSYRYDGGGQRITKQVAGGNTEVYVLDGSSSLGVVTVNGSGTPVFWFFNVLAGDRVVGRQPNVGNRKYYHTDLLGSTRAVVEGTTVVESYDPEPWGLLMPGRTLGSGTKEGFTGKERDAESGLDYFGARLYMPALGRWTSVDPLAEKHPEWSPYNYVLNNPLVLFDPDGRQVVANGSNTWTASKALTVLGQLGERSEAMHDAIVWTLPTMLSIAVSLGGSALVDGIASTAYDIATGSFSLRGAAANFLPGPSAKHVGAAVDLAGDASRGASKIGGDAAQTSIEPYNRRKHYGNTPTKADRKALGATSGQVADHEPELVKRYYEGDPKVGEKPGKHMTDAERRKSANDRDRMRLQSKDESNKQGGRAAQYSKEQKKKLESGGSQ